MAHHAPQQHPAHKTDLQRINDPNFIIDVAVGPPFPQLTPQRPGEGVVFGNHHFNEPHRFLFKKAHFSAEDYRIFDGTKGAPTEGRLCLVSHHPGKNPYEALDPLGLGNYGNVKQRNGEWESACDVTGYHGMPSFRVRPKSMSAHGRQFIQTRDGSRTVCSVAKKSRMKTMSIRHNFVACNGMGDDETYELECDLMARTVAIKNEREETIAFAAKSTETLIKEAAYGGGSEMIIDVAPGVDWTAILAIIIGWKQVGEHFAKDALKSFVVSPLQNEAVDYVGDVTGLGAIGNEIGQMTDGATYKLDYAQRAYNQFFR